MGTLAVLSKYTDTGAKGPRATTPEVDLERERGRKEGRQTDRSSQNRRKKVDGGHIEKETGWKMATAAAPRDRKKISEGTRRVGRGEEGRRIQSKGLTEKQHSQVNGG